MSPLLLCSLPLRALPPVVVFTRNDPESEQVDEPEIRFGTDGQSGSAHTLLADWVRDMQHFVRYRCTGLPWIVPQYSQKDVCESMSFCKQDTRHSDPARSSHRSLRVFGFEALPLAKSRVSCRCTRSLGQGYSSSLVGMRQAALTKEDANATAALVCEWARNFIRTGWSVG